MVKQNDEVQERVNLFILFANNYEAIMEEKKRGRIILQFVLSLFFSTHPALSNMNLQFEKALLSSTLLE